MHMYASRRSASLEIPGARIYAIGCPRDPGLATRKAKHGTERPCSGHLTAGLRSTGSKNGEVFTVYTPFVA